MSRALAHDPSRCRLKVRQRLMVYLHPMSSADSRVSCDTTERSVSALLGTLLLLACRWPLPCCVCRINGSGCGVQVGGRSPDRSLRPLTYHNRAHAMPACKTWLASPSVPHALGRESVQFSPCFVSSRLVCCFTRVVSSDRWVLFELVPRRLWRLWRFVGVKATFWRAHIVFRLVRVNSRADPLGAVALWRF